MELEEIQVNKFNYIEKLKGLHGDIVLHSIGEQSYIKELNGFQFSTWENQDHENYLCFGGAEYQENGWPDIEESSIRTVYGTIEDITIVLKSSDEIRLQVA